MTTTRLIPKSPPTLQAWQVGSGIPPAWAEGHIESICGDLVLNRRSGRQLLRPGEWLIKPLDARDLIWCTDADKRRCYDEVAL